MNQECWLARSLKACSLAKGLLAAAANIWERTVIFIIVDNRQMLEITNKTKKTLGK